MSRRKTLLVVVAVAIAVAVPVAWAAFTLTVHAPITVSVVPVTTALLTSVTLDNVQCTIGADGTTATCPTYAGQMFIGEAFPLSVTVQNSGTLSAPVAVNPTSDNTLVATVAAGPNNPTTLTAGASATFSFTVTAKAAGTANVQVAISG